MMAPTVMLLAASFPLWAGDARSGVEEVPRVEAPVGLPLAPLSASPDAGGVDALGRLAGSKGEQARAAQAALLLLSEPSLIEQAQGGSASRWAGRLAPEELRRIGELSRALDADPAARRKLALAQERLLQSGEGAASPEDVARRLDSLFDNARERAGEPEGSPQGSAGAESLARSSSRSEAGGIDRIGVPRTTQRAAGIKGKRAWLSILSANAVVLFGAYRELNFESIQRYYRAVAVAEHHRHAWTWWELFDVGGLNDFLTVPTVGAIAYLLFLLYAGLGKNPVTQARRREKALGLAVASLALGGLMALLLGVMPARMDVMNIGAYTAGGLVTAAAAFLAWWPFHRGGEVYGWLTSKYLRFGVTRRALFGPVIAFGVLLAYAIFSTVIPMVLGGAFMMIARSHSLSDWAVQALGMSLTVGGLVALFSTIVANGRRLGTDG